MHIKKIAEGLTILAKYEDAMMDAQHDTIYAGAEGASEEDVKLLSELGWSREDDSSWMCFT